MILISSGGSSITSCSDTSQKKSEKKTSLPRINCRANRNSRLYTGRVFGSFDVHLFKVDSNGGPSCEHSFFVGCFGAHMTFNLRYLFRLS